MKVLIGVLYQWLPNESAFSRLKKQAKTQQTERSKA
ncbi:hypothetical protein VIBHAR_01098 [Vibrio campbellii ATCC BAA-1116]|uniref:Uncharacterized protein n=1 Tax=Vibrio campbellii (strain ATCC BAA-1116) TaxID=2902295 RepID=A7MZE1_VIBC1|nr:hypothetical protein VIBHAR_01098 [Vibrio campbellii ATCC BAA-1116]